ncbi:MAG: hypothetical protein HY403_03155 [Elusimicrobia bacterium]|nr:hypothetical protein [Elusimicrobiota bacterium]
MSRGLAAVILVLVAALPAAAVRPTARAREEAKRFGLNKLDRAARRSPRAGVKNEFSRFNAAHEGRWRLRFDPRTGAPAALSDGRTAPRAGAPAAVARRFLQEQGALLGVDPNDLQVEKETRGSGHRHVLYRQLHRGVPVEFARVKVHLGEDGAVLGVNSTYEPDLNLSLTPAISASEAARAAESDSGGSAEGSAVLVILPVESTGRSHLAWKLRVKASQAAWRYYVDARTGQILFRYNNLRFQAEVCLTSGVIRGSVYDINPSSTPAAERPIAHQWVYLADASARTLTRGDGSFCGGVKGKVSMGLQGPYVSAANFRGASMHYDNGGGAWTTVATPVSSQHPYANSAAETATIDLTSLNPAPVKFLPIFSSFKVGEFSGADPSDPAGGGIVDDDQLGLSDGNGDPVASFIGSRGAFSGAAVAGKVMRLALRSNESGQQAGYDVSFSSYLTLASPFDYGAAGTSSHVWSAADAPAGLRGELNLFYHLNAMRDYFFNDVNRSSAAPVSRPVVAMAHVGPNMSNAFYNPDYDNLMFGDVNAAAPQDTFTDDATVSRHEYVHYLVEKIWSIQNFGQAGAISEAVADYFAASSLNESSIGASALGASMRELDCQKTAPCRALSALNWVGEIHEDSIYLSQALWDVRRERVAALGLAAGRSCADGLLFQSLLFFPESFGEVYDSMRRVEAEGSVAACGASNAAARTAIDNAFSTHGLILGSGDAFERNDGFETATDVSTRATVSATLFPVSDADFYSFGAGPGLIKLTLSLPPSGGYFNAYQVKLYDRSRRLVASAAPAYNGVNTDEGVCLTFDCTTTASSVELLYNNPAGGQFYAHVSGGEAADGTSSGVQPAPYSLAFVFTQAGALGGSIVAASFDNDVISFSVDVSSFVSNQDWRFSSAQLRDHAFTPLLDTRLNQPALAGDLLTLVSASNANGRITGSVRLAPGFAARYPSAGTVHLEIFGYNVHGSTSSLGLSNPLNLTASAAELTAYNNVFNPARGEKATIKYATLEPGRVVIKLFTVTGTYIATLLDADMPAGRGAVDWGGRNVAGSVVASGVYLARIDAPGIHKTQKVAIIK